MCEKVESFVSLSDGPGCVMISVPVVLITGAGRGLGQAMALVFAKKGYAVGINYVLEESGAEKTQGLIQNIGVPVLLLKADVRKSSEVNHMVKTLEKEWGRIDVLINNAGLTRDSRLVNMKDEDWKEAIDVNLTGAFYCTRAVLPIMMKAKNGAILNMTSYVARRPSVGAANYAAAKAGLISLTQSTALEAGPYHIRANAIMPGFHVTDMNRSIWKRFEEKIRGEHLLGQMPTKEEFSDFVVRIAELRTVTGQIFAFESRLL